MALTAGTRIGPYEITAAIGAGGMGEVYRAHDARLRRDVAIKVLPEAVAADPERLARFEREAQLLAALSHPNIGQIYGIEHGTSGENALILELIEGPTLADRIAEGPIPLNDALPLAKQIADAVEAAHEQGIVHRDLKPANVKLTADDKVKVLDFGLAKAFAQDSPTGSTSNSPTLTARATQLGMILGTAAYMAPEQARGKVVDRRADVWAFGAVFYEMLTGQRAFGGDDVTAVLARVIEREADLNQLPPTTPATLRRLLERCLTKDPRQRLRDIGEARIALDRVMAGDDEPPAAPGAAPQTPRRSPRLPWAIAGAFAVLSLLLLIFPGTAGAPGGEPLNASLLLPPDVEFFSSPSVSADGSVVAFVGVREGVRQAYVRRLDSFDILPLGPSVSVLTVSPDGQSLAVVTSNGELRRLSVDGSVSQALLGEASPRDLMTWTNDDEIIFSRSDGLWAVPASGGDARQLTTLDVARQEAAHRYPVMSTDGAYLLFNSFTSTTGGEVRLEAYRMTDDTRSVLLSDASQAIWASGDRLVFARDSGLYTVGFRDGQLTDAPVRRLDDVSYTVINGWSASLSDTGSLLVASDDVSRARLVWVSADGVERPVGGPVRAYGNARLSPDGRSIAFSDGNGLWTLDIVRQAVTRVAPSGARYAVWLPDSTGLIYYTMSGLMVVRTDGRGQPEPLDGTTSNDFPGSVSPDGTTLAAVRITPATSGDVVLIPLDGEGQLERFISTPAYDGGAQFSPDGNWIAYQSDESGRSEVFLRPYPSPDRRWAVSTGGGLHPLWSGDGRRIFYRSGQRVMAVDVELGDEVRLSPPVELFERQYKFGPNLSIPYYSLSPDGQGFLMVKEDPGARALTLITSWLGSVPARR